MNLDKTKIHFNNIRIIVSKNTRELIKYSYGLNSPDLKVFFGVKHEISKRNAIQLPGVLYEQINEDIRMTLEELNWIREHKGQVKVQIQSGVWVMIVDFEMNGKRHQFLTPVDNEKWFEEMKIKFDFN